MRTKVAETIFKHLKEVLAKVELNLASERKRREVKVAKSKEELAKEEKKVGEKAMEVYKASMDFMVEKARVVAVSQASDE